ncbi:MAG: hypothetical protein IT292_07550 [Deltaproteobacteria bacterium]|nr:hypothetical protein [Deltaproteobacteria bacterium]
MLIKNIKNSVCHSKSDQRLFNLYFISFVGFCLAFISSFIFKATPAPVLFRGWGLFRGHDGSHYYFWLRSIIFDGDFVFKNDIINDSLLPETTKQLLLSQPLTDSGLLPNKYPIGWAIMLSPAILIGYLSAFVLNLFGFNYAIDGYSLPYQLAITRL